MADQMDQAQEYNELYLQIALDKQRANQEGDDAGNNRGMCIDCDESIEPGRVKLGMVRCFECQSIKEKQDNQYAR